MQVAVIGAGTMGSGIAQACASAGHSVMMYDSQEAALERGRNAISSSLERLVKKGKLSDEDKASVLNNIQSVTDMQALQGAEMVIEAVFEKLEVKQEVWQKLSSVVSAEALLASNTSSLSITEIASYVSHPERFCGMHFFNPVAVLPLVEVIAAIQTSEETLQSVRDFAAGLGKTPIVCQDRPGFIVNRLLIPYMNEAAHVYGEGLASAEDIDSAMKLGANMPIGPLALCDLVGIDVTVAAAESLYNEFQDSKFRLAPALRQLLRAGKLGRKSGEGFYRYD